MRYGDRYLPALPMFHVGALTPVMANIYLGITTVILKTFDAKQAWELIRDENTANVDVGYLVKSAHAGSQSSMR